MRKQFSTLVKNFARDDRGASLLEYTILLGLVTAVSVTIISAFGTWILQQWQALATALGITLPA